MRLSDVSIRNPVFAWMLMFALMIFGVISFSRMGLSQMPDVDFPTVSVNVTMEGAAPEVMETQVVDVIESAIMGVEGVQRVTSTSKSGTASITVEFELGRDIDVALQDVQAKVSSILSKLPSNADSPTFSKVNSDDQPIMMLAITYDGDRKFLMQYVRDYLKDQFTIVPGVGDLFIGGYIDPVLEVTVRPKDLRQHNVTVTDVITAIKNEHSETPGGFFEDGKKAYNVRTMGEVKSVDDFKNLLISQRGGQTVQDSTNILRIRQVADVDFGLHEVRRISRFNGQTAVGIGIRKQRGSNAVAVAQAVKQKVELLKTQIPQGMKISLNFDNTRFIEDSVHELNRELLMAVLLTSLVCWIFLGSWSATFNVLLSIPTSLLGSFIVLYFLGYTLNTFTLLGLTLAIGIVVDDAIMVLENIFRHGEHGMGKVQAAIIGAREITFAAMAATAAIIAIFLPVAFMKGIIGKYFLQFGVTISVAVILSLLEALTITPMRCASFVEHGERTTKIGRAFEAMMKWAEVTYKKWLIVVIQHRIVVIVLSIIFVLSSFFSLRFLNKELAPLQDQSVFIVRVRMPIGTSLEYTNEQVQKIEDWLRKRPEVDRVFALAGSMGSTTVRTAADANQGFIYVTMKTKAQRPKDPETGKALTQQQFMQLTRKFAMSVKDVKPILVDLSQRGFSTGKGYPVEFTVTGSDWDKLAKTSDLIMEDMKKSGNMVDVDSDYLLGMPEVQIVPERVNSVHNGVSVATIGSTVNALIGGVKAGEYPQGGHRYDIRVKLQDEGHPMELIHNLFTSNSKGNLIPLDKVTTYSTVPTLQQITRQSRQRAITVTANLKPGTSQQTALNEVSAISKKYLEPGYMINQSGNSQAFKESFESLIFALILGLVVAYMVLGTQFNSFIDPISVLVALPFSVSGAFFSLMITGQSLNMYSMIGLLLLMGIVKKNSILLVDFTNAIRTQKKLNAVDSLIEACPIRLRPIIMTSFATIAAAIPSAVSTGTGSESMRPMAITVIGGVLVSTILTLFVVPCFYIVLDRFKKRDRIADETHKAFVEVGDKGIV